MPNKPTTLPLLDTNSTNRTAPAAGAIANGYVLNDVLPAANANYLWGYAGDWLTWLDSNFGDGTAADDLLIDPPSSGHVRINADVGIGIDPATSLHISAASAGAIIDATSGVSSLSFRRASVDKWSLRQDVNDLEFWFSGASKLVFEGDGSTGHLYPLASTQDLGKDANRWGTLFATRGAIGTAPESANVAWNLERTSAANTNEYTVLAEHIFSTTFTGQKNAIGAVINDNHASGTLTDVRAFFANYDCDAADDVTAYYGFRSFFDVDAPSAGPVVTSLYNFFGQGSVAANGEVTNLVGYQYNEGTLTGTVGTQYGARIGLLDGATTNIGIKLDGVTDGASDYAILSSDGQVSFSHSYAGAAARSANVFDFFVATAGGLINHQAILTRIRSDLTANLTGALTNVYAQSIKTDAFDVTSWYGVRSRIQDGGTPTGTVASWLGFLSDGNVTGFGVTSYVHFQASDAAGAATVGTQYAFFAQKMDKATTNYGLYLEGVGTGANDYAIYSVDGRTYVEDTFTGTGARLSHVNRLNAETAGGVGAHAAVRNLLYADMTGGSTSSVVVSDNIYFKEDSQNHSSAIGVSAKCDSDTGASGALTAWNGFWSDVVADGFSITNVRHFRAREAFGASAITTAYGFYCENLQKASNNYGLYIEDASTAAIYVAAGDTVLNGLVGIGKTPAAGDGELQIDFATDDLGFIDASDTGTRTTEAGWIQVKVGTATRYIRLYTT